MSGKRYVFLSYGRKDVYPTGATNPVEQEQHFPLVEKVYHHLNGLKDALGLEPWFDKRCLTHDRPFTDSIHQAIEQADYLLLFIGAHSMASEWCEREWKHALRHCVPIIPILLEGNWGDVNIQAAYPPRILSTSGIDPRRADKSLDEQYLLKEVVNAVQKPVAPLAIAYNARTLPDHYIDRPQYIDDLKKRLGVNDINYRAQSNIVGITSKQESAALQGVGGIGKTTLALALCNDCDVRRAFDHIFWLEAGPDVKAEAAPGLMKVIGTHFGDNPELYNDPQTARALLQKHLSGKRSLLVLDDVWHEGLKEQFSLAGLDLRLVVTTRQKRLVDHPETVDKLSADEGLRLLATLFNQANPDPTSLTADHRAIVSELDGYTLAIEIAGKWLNKYGHKRTADYVKRLQGDEDTLFKHLELPQMSDKNANLEKSLRLSYNDLGADDQRRFRALGMFAAGSSFPLAALDAVWETEDGFMEAEWLVDAGLLERATPTPTLPRVQGRESDASRYTQHTLLRAYARALLTRAGETDSLFPRFADYYIKLAEQFNTLPPEKWGGLDDDLPNIHLTGDELVKQTDSGQKGDQERAQEFAYNVTWYLFRRRQVRRMEWTEMGLNAAHALQTTAADKSFYLSREARFLGDLGLAWSALGEKRRALEYYERALPLFSEVGDRGGEATTLNNIGIAWDALGEKRKALEYYELSLPLFSAVGNRGGEAMTLNNIGKTWGDLGEKRRALEFYKQALPLRREVGDRGGEAATLNNIGGAWADLGEKWRALEFYEQALPLSREVGDHGGEAATLNNIAAIYYAEGDLQKALETFKQIVDIVKQTGNVSLEATLHANMAVIYKGLGQMDSALAEMREAIIILKGYNLPYSGGGGSVEEYEAQLREWEQPHPPTPSPQAERGSTEDEAAQAMAMLVQLYRKRGEDGLRAALAEMGADAAVIEQVVAVVRGNAGR